LCTFKKTHLHVIPSRDNWARLPTPFRLSTKAHCII
jgi:hypothetical protein